MALVNIICHCRMMTKLTRANQETVSYDIHNFEKKSICKYEAAEKVIKMRVAEKVTDWFGKHSSFLANAAMQLLQPSADYRFCLAISYGVLKTSATRSMRGNTTP